MALCTPANTAPGRPTQSKTSSHLAQLLDRQRPESGVLGIVVLLQASTQGRATIRACTRPGQDSKAAQPAWAGPGCHLPTHTFWALLPARASGASWLHRGSTHKGGVEDVLSGPQRASQSPACSPGHEAAPSKLRGICVVCCSTACVHAAVISEVGGRRWALIRGSVPKLDRVKFETQQALRLECGRALIRGGEVGSFEMAEPCCCPCCGTAPRWGLDAQPHAQCDSPGQPCGVLYSYLSQQIAADTMHVMPAFGSAPASTQRLLFPASQFPPSARRLKWRAFSSAQQQDSGASAQQQGVSNNTYEYTYRCGKVQTVPL